jgi:predicted DNA-binding transcriptional regulator
MAKGQHYYLLTDEQVATILGALRFYQRSLMYQKSQRPDWLEYIVSNRSPVDSFLEVKPLNSEQIDQLCKELNYDSSFYNVVPSSVQ